MIRLEQRNLQFYFYSLGVVAHSAEMMRLQIRIVACGRAAEVAMAFVADDGQVVPRKEVALRVRETARGAQRSGLCDLPVICSRRHAVGKTHMERWMARWHC